MGNVTFRKISAIIDLIVIFNLVFLIFDLILIYFASRGVQKLYTEIGLQSIYDIGVYNIRVQSTIVILVTVAAKYKFWEQKGKSFGRIDKFILFIVFLALLYGSFTVIRIFLETVSRI